MLSKQQKQEIIAKYRINDNDTGSSAVQIAILTAEMTLLTEHLKVHKHDFHSKRGLFQKIGQRKRLLNYLQREDLKRYQAITQSLDIRINKQSK
ncbi:MAG: 30S ribosomal protein S15 [Erysipelotrichales bacterium]|nr:30S ribosomal protein S15 [Erysipelotrichales bacterium]